MPYAFSDPLSGPLYGLNPSTMPSFRKGTNKGDLLSRKKALEEEILAINAMLNTTLPISQLPNEILTEIFLLSRPARSGAWRTTFTDAESEQSD